MPDSIVDESRFIIDDDFEEVFFFTPGFELPDGLIFGEKLDETDAWQLYLSDDGLNHILAVKAELALRWCEKGYVPRGRLWFVDQAQAQYALLISPASLRLERVTASRFCGSARYALAFAAAVAASRTLDVGINLRDAIFCEQLGIMLPCYTLVPRVSDRALFENALRDPKSRGEDLSAEGGLGFVRVRECLKNAGLTWGEGSPWLESGERLDDFIQGAAGGLVSGPLMLRRHYQLFDTNLGKQVLLIDSLWAEALMEAGFLSQIAMNTVSLGAKTVYSMVMDKRKAVEALDDRHFGMAVSSALEFAEAVARTRETLPQAGLAGALYVQDLGVLLPERFSGGSAAEDPALVRDVLSRGPYALGPLLVAVIDDCVRMVTV